MSDFEKIFLFVRILSCVHIVHQFLVYSFFFLYTFCSNIWCFNDPVLHLITAPTLSVSPIPAPPHLPSTHAASSTHDSRKHSSLIFILGISSGTLVIIIISVIILSKCQPHQGPENAPATETGKYFEFSFGCTC